MEDIRSIPLIDRLSFEIPGNVTSSTICLGDVDNNGEFELCIGSSTGQLSIFKDLNADPWARKTKLGHIVALASGDLFNRGQNILVVIAADGLCRVFDFARGVVMVEANESDKSLTEKSLNDSSGDDSSSVRFHQMVNPCFEQLLPPNVKQVQIKDVNDDGLNELVVTLTDRVVRTYQWRNTTRRVVPPPPPPPSPPPKSPPSPKADQETTTTSSNPPSSSEEEEEEEKENNEDDLLMEGELVALSKWEFADQVGCFATCKRDGQTQLLVTQCDTVLKKVKGEDHFQETDIFVHLGSEHETPPEIVTDLAVNSSPTSSLVLSTANGTVLHLFEDQLNWKHDFGNHLFGLSKLDVNMDGSEEVVVSTWDGQTYIIDVGKGKSSVFHFDDEICGFSCGLFTVDHKTLPALVYATFSGMVHVYYKLWDFEARQMRRGVGKIGGRDLSPRTVSRLLYGGGGQQ